MKHFGEFVDTPRTVRFPPDVHWRHWRAPPLLVTWSQSHWSFYLSIYFLFYNINIVSNIATQPRICISNNSMVSQERRQRW